MGSAQILENVIGGNTSGASGGGIALSGAGAPIVRGNVISGNIAGSGGGISMENYSNPTIIQNVIARNRASSGGGMSWVVSSGSPLLVNNTIVDNDSAQGSGAYVSEYWDQGRLFNNLIVAKAGQAALYCGQDFPIMQFNDIYAPSGSAFEGLCTNAGDTTGNISADPLFVDQARGDYRLQSGSPAIDAGTNTAEGLPATDIAGNPRIAGGGNGVVDMGAYEVTAFPPPVALAPAGGDLGTMLAGSPPVSRTVTLANSGASAVSVFLTGVAANDASAFTVAPGGPNPCGSLAPVIASGASCTLTLGFTPGSAGFKTGELVVMSDAVGSPALARFAATVLAVDTTPEAFSFDARRDVARHGVTTSNALTVSGINAPAAISIAGGEYSVDGGTYTAAPGSVGNGQQVSVRLVASSSYSTTTTATLTIGGVSANFNATTPSTFSSAPYLPLAIGNNWTMSPAGGYSITGMRVVNGESTFVLSSSDGSEIYLTNDALGVHIHGTYTPPQPIAGCSAAAETDIFSPPLVLASTGASQGRAADSNGTVTVDLGACGTASFGYWAMSTPQAPEVVAVPAGKFEAVRLDLNITVNGVMIGSMRYWLAAGIGFVKQADGTGAVSELESTNVVRTEPDPIQFASRTGVPLGGLVESNPVTITGITGAAPLSIAGGEYSIDGGAYRGTAGTVANGDTLKVRLTSPAAGNTASSATLAVGDLAAVFAATTSKAWSLLPGWNLLGNGASGALDVAAALGDAAKVATVWKWVPGALKWALYTPSLSAAELSAYAAGKGYDVLVTVNGGEGFWVNARTGFDIQSPSGTPIASTSLYSMNSGWNLVAVGDDKTPVQLNAAMGDLTTLWAWDPATSRWYFYAPSLDAQGGTALADYIAAKGYRDFAADSKKLDPWTGFWVNKP